MLLSGPTGVAFVPFSAVRHDPDAKPRPQPKYQFADAWSPDKGFIRARDLGDVTDDKALTDFHLGSYVDEPASTMTCRGCLGDVFHIGFGDRETFAKCPSCGWEMSIHEG